MEAMPKLAVPISNGKKKQKPDLDEEDPTVFLVFLNDKDKCQGWPVELFVADHERQPSCTLCYPGNQRPPHVQKHRSTHVCLPPFAHKLCLTGALSQLQVGIPQPHDRQGPSYSVSLRELCKDSDQTLVECNCDSHGPNVPSKNVRLALSVCRDPQPADCRG